MDTLEATMMQADCLMWCDRKGLQLSDGVPFELTGRPYLKDIVNCDKKIMSVKKGSQVCLTTAKYLEAVHGCVYRHYDKNIIYMLPTVKQAETLSKISFDPIFAFNPFLKKMLSNNSASLKTINGRSIVFVGAQGQKVGETSTKDSVNLRSIPADVVYRDEIDMMDQDMVEISRQRLNASRHRLECNFASPTIPGHGIDSLWDEGDMRHFQIRCRHCGKYTVLGRDFPKSILCVGGVWRRSCVSCGKEIFTGDGKFVAEYPDRRCASFWVDGFMNPMADLEGYMYRYHNPKNDTAAAEFDRSILGIATIEASSQLSEADVKACRGNQGMATVSSAETCIGIDTGNGLHYVQGYRTAEDTYRILRVGHLESKDISYDPYADIHDTCEKMNTRCGVIDLGPDIHAVRKWQTTEDFETFRCNLPEEFGSAKFDHKEKRVRANRNLMCGKVHGVVTGGHLVTPRGCPEMDDFAKQLTKMAKLTTRHPDTGVPKTRWIKVGDKQDHFFHAFLYFLLACKQRSPVREEGPRKPMKLRSRFYV